MAIKDGKIAAVGAGLAASGMQATEVYDATGQHVAPGWIDPHTHFVRLETLLALVTARVFSTIPVVTAVALFL